MAAAQKQRRMLWALWVLWALWALWHSQHPQIQPLTIPAPSARDCSPSHPRSQPQQHHPRRWLPTARLLHRPPQCLVATRCLPPSRSPGPLSRRRCARWHIAAHSTSRHRLPTPNPERRAATGRHAVTIGSRRLQIAAQTSPRGWSGRKEPRSHDAGLTALETRSLAKAQQANQLLRPHSCYSGPASEGCGPWTPIDDHGKVEATEGRTACRAVHGTHLETCLGAVVLPEHQAKCLRPARLEWDPPDRERLQRRSVRQSCRRAMDRLVKHP